MVKTFNRITAFVFIVLAMIQLLQRGSWLWILLFLYGALLCYFASLKKQMVLPHLVGLAAHTVYAAYLFFGKQGVYAWIRSPETSVADPAGALVYKTGEFCGFMLLVTVLLINMLWLRRQQKSLV